MQTLRPLRDKIVVKPDPEAELERGIYVGPTDLKTGTVVACGPGGRDDDGVAVACPLAVGDRIQYTGTNDTRFGDVLLMSWRDAIGVLHA